jgi:LacI family transcriptional regulator
LIGLAYPLDEARQAETPSRDDDASALYTDAIIRSASWQASLLGYSLFSCAVRVENPSETQLALQHLAGGVDGMILADRVSTVESVRRLTSHLPTVHLSGAETVTTGGTLQVDNFGGIRALVEHLVTVHSLRDFGFVSGIAESPDAQARERAFHQSVAEHGGIARPENLLRGDFSLLKAEEALTARLKATGLLPEVFLCANDQMALGISHCLQEHGISVPDQVKVTGFDDIGLASFATPPLTTVAQPSFQLGASAVNLLVALLDDEVEPGATITLPTRLTLRRSCGCSGDDRGIDRDRGVVHAGIPTVLGESR